MKWRELDPFLRAFWHRPADYLPCRNSPFASFPFPSPLDDPGSVLAVKGPLRLVPRPGPLRADPKKGCLRGNCGQGVHTRTVAHVLGNT